MPLNEEIKQTATNLGLALAASPELQELMNLNEFDAAYDRQIEVHPQRRALEYNPGRQIHRFCQVTLSSSSRGTEFAISSHR